MKSVERLIICVLLILPAYTMCGCKDEVEAISDYELTLDPCNTTITYNDIEFAYDSNGINEVLTLNVIDGVIICSRPPKKAIEIIFKSLCSAYDVREVEDWPVRFPEPNDQPYLKLDFVDAGDYEEPNEPEFYIEISEQPETIAMLSMSGLMDVVFSQGDEELRFTFQDPNVYIYKVEPEEAVSFMINALYKCMVSEEDVVVKYEPNEPELVIDTIATDKLFEPNEPECEHKNKTYSSCLVAHPPGVSCERCMDCGEYVVSEIEPNEPNDLALTYDATRGKLGISLDFIPTWPAFIELDRDLVLRYDFPEPNNPLLIHTPSEFRVFSKGTKIYFKDD